MRDTSEDEYNALVDELDPLRDELERLPEEPLFAAPPLFPPYL